MRYSLKTLLALPLIVIVTYSTILPFVYSERYYVLSNLHIKDWDLLSMEESELDQMIFGKESDSFYMSNTTDGIKTSVQMFGFASSTASTRWDHKKAVEKVDKQMREFLGRNPDLVSDWAAIEIYTYEYTMVGVGKLLKQAQKMQQKMEEAQASLSEEILEVSGGGGAVSIKISGMGEFKDLKLDPEFLKEDPEFVSDAILQAIVDASEQAKKKNDDAMSGLTGGMQMPGLF